MCNGLVIKIMWLHVCKLSTNGAGALVSIWYLELLSKWIMSANCCQGFAVRFLTTTITLNIRPLGKQLLVLSTSSPESGSIFSIFPLPCCMGLADSHASKECARQPLIYNHEFCLQMFSFTERAHDVPRKRTKMQQILSKSLAAFTWNITKIFSSIHT